MNPRADPDEAAPGIAALISGGRTAAARVRRMLIVKPDHIGDLLIAAPALMALRRSFADAHITLLCGPWNVGLARRLGIADTIYPTDLFAQNSLDDMDAIAREARWAEAVTAIRALELGSFDLAIDLRRDEDTRALLKLFDAKLRVGFGDLQTYSYLDMALPVTHRGYDVGTTSLSLGPRDLEGGMGHEISDAGLHLTARTSHVDFELCTDTVWPPSDEGLDDNRPLGAALSRIDIRPLAGGDRARGSRPAARLTEVPRESMEFGAGWLPWESWGRWSTIARAPFSVHFRADQPEVEILVRVQGHTAASHPSATVAVVGGGAEVSHHFRRGDEATILSLRCRTEMATPVVRSRPYLLRAGRYSGNLRVYIDAVADWFPLTLTVQGEGPASIRGRVVTPATVAGAGTLDFPFEIELRDTAEPLLIEIEGDSGDVERASRLAIVSVTLDCMQAKSPELPVAHMEAQLLDLAMLTALRYAPAPVTAGDVVGARLAAHRAGSSATAAVARLRRRKGRWPRPRRSLIGIGIGANKETKLWPRASFAALARMLLDRPAVDIVLIGGPADTVQIRALAGDLDAGERVLDLCASCRIEDLGEVLVELDGFVGLDTGTTHFAGRVGVPTVALFGASHDPLIWGPVGAKSAWAAIDMACGGCSKSEASQCPIGVQCMTRLTPEAVWPIVERAFFGNGRADVAR